MNFDNDKFLNINSNIVKWYDFESDKNALVIGDETGKVTDYLSKKLNEVTVLEKNDESYNNLIAESMINKKISVIKKDILETTLDEKFEYIIILGTLQFKYDDSKNIEILKKVKEYLSENGTILLAVNNAISLKFLSELDVNCSKIEGISKHRLEEILNNSGLVNYKFYYPLPDYKKTNVIFTDDYMPSITGLERNLDLKEEVEKKNFDDRRILSEIVENSNYDFKYYCNSFLVEISNKEKNDKVKSIYFNNVRKSEFQLVTKMLKDNVIKYSVTEESKKHLENIENNIDILNYVKINTLDNFADGKVNSKYIENGVSLQDLFLQNFKLNRFGEIEKIIERYKNEILMKLEVVSSDNNVFQKYNLQISSDKINKLTFVKYGLWDLIFQNIFIIDNEFFVYDQEWCAENVPIEFIIYRSIKYLPQVTNEDRERLYKFLGLQEYLNEFLELENNFQDKLLDKEIFADYIKSLKSYETINEASKLYMLLQEKDNQINSIKEENVQLKNKNNEELIRIENEKNEEIRKLIEENSQKISNLQSEQNQNVEYYKKEIEFKQGMIDSKEMLNSYINKELNNFSNAYFHVNKEISKIQQQLEQKNQELTNVYNSEQFQKGAIALKREKDLYPILATVRGIKQITKKVFRPVKVAVLTVVRKIGKTLFELYPNKEQKRNFKHKFLYSSLLSKIANVVRYEAYCINPPDVMLMEDGTQEACVKYQVELNKTFAIHLHLYYEDLLDEFYNYFCNIPYVFDLYVSVMEGANVKKIYKKFNHILNLNKVVVKVVPNSGRDFGAMFVEFREDLKKYDYIMHVHTKKSLRMGNEQSNWRRYMLDNLIGSTERVMKNFYLLEQMNMGMVYVDSMPGPCPYWINTWLGEGPLAKKLLEKMGIEYKDEILQFPAGSMAFYKKDALRQLFDLNLTWEDFGYEKDGNDEINLAYVFERITGKVAKHNGYNIAIYNPEEKRYRRNFGEQRLKDYNVFNRDIIFNISMNYDILSFDIFDTLITRNVYDPKDSFEIISNRINEKNIEIDNYYELRKQAEFNVRKNKNFKGDCNIHEIYKEFQKLTNLSKEETDLVKQIEIQTEYDLVIPRYDMLEIYNRLLQNGKKIVLVSDMYLTKEMITKMLKKCGYDNWYELLVSSELGYRKDNETMWEYFFEKYKEFSTNHIGDNEYSDIHAVAKQARSSLHVFKGTKLNTYLMPQKYVLENEKLNLLESIVMGSIVNRVVCNSPFVLNSINSQSIINNYYDFGYAALGPIMLKYILWIYKMAKEEKNGEVLLFSAREGYYLQKLFSIVKEKLGDLPNVEDHYLYISRRAVTVIGIETIDDVRKIMQTMYNGSLRELLYYRLNYKENNFKDQIISLPWDIDKVMKVVEDNFEIILANAKKEKETYLKYIDSLNIDFDNKKVSILDLGYAGTAQYYLAKILNKKISGKYFVVESNLKPIKIGCDVYSCFNKSIYNKEIDKNIIFKNSLFLESFLTSPDGQFVYMDIKDGKFIPNFLHENDKQEHMKKLDEVYRGVKDFVETVLDLLGNKVFDYEIDNKYIYRTYEMCLRESNKFSEEMKSLFLIEDYYISNAILNGFDIYQTRKKDWNYE